MNRKFKLTLDIIMISAAITLYGKNIISMKYHEIAGLILFALCFLHVIINLKMMRAFVKNFTKVPIRIKTGLIVDILLLLCFIFITISGIMISKTVLTGISSPNTVFRFGHSFAAALSVILLGIHLGLHFCQKRLPAAAAVLLSILALSGGIFGLAGSQFTRYISSPFTVKNLQNADISHGQIKEGSMPPEQMPDAESDFAPGDAEKGTGHGQGYGRGNGNGHGRGNDFGNGNGNGKGFQNQGSFLSRIVTPLHYAGMILLFSMLTYFIFFPKKQVQND